MGQVHLHLLHVIAHDVREVSWPSDLKEAERELFQMAHDAQADVRQARIRHQMCFPCCRVHAQRLRHHTCRHSRSDIGNCSGREGPFQKQMDKEDYENCGNKPKNRPGQKQGIR